MENEDKQFVRADKFIPIKGTDKKDMEAAKRAVQQQCDSINARKTQEKIKAEAAKHQAEYQTEPQTSLPGGGVVLGKLTEEEKRAMASGDERLIRKCALLRQKAFRMSQSKYGKGGRSYQGLSKFQGRLPQSPYRDRDNFLTDQ